MKLQALRHQQNFPAHKAVLQFKISLNYSESLIWRRVLVPPTFTFDNLHQTIQALFGWEESHPHEFNAGKAFRGEKISGRIPLTSYFERAKQKANYTYDFGDSWEHDIVFEKWAEANKTTPYPTCIAGENNAPPEDCGGIPGYYLMLEAVKDKNHPDHEDLTEWLGEDFDPAFFDMTQINVRLKKIKGKKKEK